MGLFDRFSRKKIDRQLPALAHGAKDFFAGKKNTLTSADIDPDGAEKYLRYVEAMTCKRDGDISSAEALLLQSCVRPSIYKGHYCELFKIWRQFNRDDLKAHRHEPVVGRVLTMTRLDEEMIQEMIRYWSVQQNRKLPQNYFDKDRNLLITDAKALLKAAEELGDHEHAAFATSLVHRFFNAKKGQQNSQV